MNRRCGPVDVVDDAGPAAADMRDRPAAVIAIADERPQMPRRLS
jgi:hypothetical protein